MNVHPLSQKPVFQTSRHSGIDFVQDVFVGIRKRAVDVAEPVSAETLTVGNDCLGYFEKRIACHGIGLLGGDVVVANAFYKS